MLEAAASVKSPRRVCISECIAVCTNFGAGSLRIIFRSRAEGAWQGSRRKAPERGGVRLPRQAEAGGTSHRHPVSGPRALPPHFRRCSLGAFQWGLMLVSQVCRSCGCPRVAAGPHSISKECAACPLQRLTAGRRRLMRSRGLSHSDYWPFSSTFSAAGGATELLRGWKVAPKIALFAI